MAPLRPAPGIAARVQTALTSVEERLGAITHGAAPPSKEDQLALWFEMASWSLRNIMAISGVGETTSSGHGAGT